MQGLGPLFVFIIIVLVVTNTIKLLREWERGVVLRLGKFQAVRGPGITFVIPGIERMYRVNTRVITVDVPPQDIITKDNITLKVHAVVFFHIFSPRETIINVEDWYAATYQKAQTVLRNVLGNSNSMICSPRSTASTTACSRSWMPKPASGASRSTPSKSKHVDLPQEMQRAMAKQAEAERERRSKIMLRKGSIRPPHGWLKRRNIMGRHPITLQLRYLQTLSEIAVENNSTVIFPLPLDLVRPFLEMQERVGRV